MLTCRTVNPRTRTDERNDCTVRAITHAAGISYDEAHALLKAHGRRDRAGCYEGNFEPAYAQHGFARLPIKAKSMTVGAFVAANPKGSFILTVRSHAFAVIDGVQHDFCARPSTRKVLIAAYAKTGQAAAPAPTVACAPLYDRYTSIKDLAKRLKEQGHGVCTIIRETVKAFPGESNKTLRSALLAALDLNSGTVYRQIGEARKALAKVEK